MIKKICALFFALTFITACVKEEETTSDEQQTIVTPMLAVPANGIFNEELIIEGDTIVPGTLRFYFNGVQHTNVNYLQNNSISLFPPRSIDQVTSTLSIGFTADTIEEIIYSDNFTLRPPVINSISENLVTFGDTITIYGNDFDETQYTSVMINEASAEILNASKDSVQVRIPNALESQDLTIKVTAQLQEDVFASALSLKEPAIFTAPGTVQIGEVISLMGENFNLSTEYATVLLNGDVEAEIYSVESSSEIRIRVPFGPFKDFEIYSISYETAGMTTTYDTPIVIISKFVLFTKQDNAAVSRPFTYNNNIYSFGKDSSDDIEGPYYLYRLNTNTQLWDKFESISFPDSEFSFNHSEGGKIYVYLHLKPDNNFFVVDINAQTLEYLPDFPGAPRYSAAVIPVNGDVYLGKGKLNFNNYLSNLFKFNTDTNLWEEVTTGNKTFACYSDYEVVNGAMYMKVGDYFSSNNGTLDAFMKFNPSSESFTEEYFDCSSCSIEELLYFNTKFYSAYKNGQSMGFRNLDNNQEYININASVFYSGPNRYVTDNSHVFFWANVINTSLQTQGFYKINPNVF